MTILHGSRDRGGAPTMVMGTSQDGQKYVYGADEVKAIDFEYTSTKTSDGHNIQIKAPSKKQASNLAGKAKKELGLSDAQIAEQIANAKTVHENPGPLQTTIKTGPAIEFPAAITMATLFCAYHGLPGPPDFNSYLDSFDEKTELRPLPNDTFYFIHDKEWFQLNAEMGHCLILYGDPIRKRAIFFYQLFKLLGIAITMPFDGAEPILHTYGVDVLTGAPAEVVVDVQELCRLQWTDTHKLGEAELYAINQTRGQNLMRIAADRQFLYESKKIWDKYKDGAFTKEILELVYDEHRKLIEQSVVPEFREKSLKDFEEVFQKARILIP